MTGHTKAAAKTISVLTAAILIAGCATSVDARPQPSYTAPSATFFPVVVPTATPSTSAAPSPSVSLAPSPTPAPTPKPTRKPKPKPRPKPKPQGAIGTALIGGSATWYCCTRGYGKGEMVAAAGSELRMGNWRGRVVTVRGPRGNSIRVRLVDWCACKGNRIIDLHPAAFAALAPLSRGVVSVEVEW